MVLAAGFGHILWRMLGRPRPTRALTWLWCGLAGFCAQALGLQALVYLDFPLQATVPWAFGLAGLGVVAMGWSWLRRTSPRETWLAKEAAILLGAGAMAGLIQATAFVGIGSDRFIGAGQIDQLNYVTTSQFLVERPFSTEWTDMGLHPWLYRPVELKKIRIRIQNHAIIKT